MPRTTRLAFAVMLLAVAAPAHAQFDDEDNPYAAGLVVTIQDGAKHTAARLAGFLAYHPSPDPRLTDGEITATYTGFLRTGAAGEHRFHIHGEGEIELKVAGQATKATLRNDWFVSEAMKLPVDYLPIEVAFRGPAKSAHFTVCWSGPRFGLEPVPARALFHLVEKSPGNEFERGKALSRALRCGNCHQGESAKPGPALDKLRNRTSFTWLTQWLASGHAASATGKREEQAAPRRMPSFGMSQGDASEIVGWLLAAEDQPIPPVPKETSPPKPKKDEPAFDAKLGEQLFVTRGCLACHTWNGLGAGGWFGGGDLSAIAMKRPAFFFREWLADPAKLNRDHRMPTFDLTEGERHALSLFLAAQHPVGQKPDFEPVLGNGPTLIAGGELASNFHCASCHRLPGPEGDKPVQPIARQIDANSKWEAACTGEPDVAKHRPGYRLEERDAKALRRYFSERLPNTKPEAPDGAMLLAESNCLACHARQGPREITPLLPPPLADKLAAVGKRYPDLASNLGALAPPSLNSVGDKLTDTALADAILRKKGSHRPYLNVRMPKFPLSDSDLKTLTDHLIADDRVPPHGEPPKLDTALAERYRVAGSRLVSGDGFGCTSCHRVGEVLPPPGPAAARGPDLAMLGSRIRREWYDRWVRDPARIVPRMEMPALQIPVGGVLEDKLDHQIAAVWHVLNLPGFEPPPPSPVRILRHTGRDPEAEAIVITDALRAGGKMYVKPFLVGLSNRHNILFDLETASLARWTIGDTARQLTKGKSWLWEAGGTPILDTGLKSIDICLVKDGKESHATTREQFAIELDEWRMGAHIRMDYRLAFKEGSVSVTRVFTVNNDTNSSNMTGFSEAFLLREIPQGYGVRIRVLSPELARTAKRSLDGSELELVKGSTTRITCIRKAIDYYGDGKFSDDGTSYDLTTKDQFAKAVFHFRTDVAVDQLPVVAVPPVEFRAIPIEVASGFTGVRLPLSPEIMPTGLAWRPGGTLVFSSLKGQVFEASDTNGDGAEDSLKILIDGLPAPYGINAGPGYVDVIVKSALYRIPDPIDGPRPIELLASGWGYTLDYHDWAIGLPRTKAGEYYIGIPCEQDKRSATGAKHHSEILKLIPREPTKDDPRRFRIETVSRGSRFPMGLALDRNEELFASDNQGNYTPFNEINHVRKGAHFGFINSLERSKPAPPVTPAAIDIPHPWCRSVNGICFLETIPWVNSQKAFGPFEGHLVGCEFNGRRLVRMTLDKVNGEYQGAVYPLSAPPTDPAKGFLGPIVCAVSPRGELYVGGVWDSGWGGGNNVGEIVKVTMQPDKLPCGIAEVKATHDGFTLHFVKPVDREAAAKLDNYAIESYRREPTPAYGGPDLERRKEKLASVTVAEDSMSVRLKLGEMRAGFLYEFTLKSLAPNGGEFFPAEAMYTLRSVPK